MCSELVSLVFVTNFMLCHSPENKSAFVLIHFSTLAVKAVFAGQGGGGWGGRKCHCVLPSLSLSFYVWVRKQTIMFCQRIWWCESGGFRKVPLHEMSRTLQWEINVLIMWLFVIVSGHRWVHLPSQGQKLWHTGALWEKGAKRCGHSCRHGRNKGNAESGHFCCVVTWGGGYSGGSL